MNNAVDLWVGSRQVATLYSEETTRYAPCAFSSGKRTKALRSRYYAKATLFCSESAKEKLRYAEVKSCVAVFALRWR
jgi:hypothetical protein